MVARVLFPWLTPWGEHDHPHPRATIKALPSAPPPLAPTDADGLFIRLMPIGRDKSGPYAPTRYSLGRIQTFIPSGPYVVPVDSQHPPDTPMV